MLTNLIWVLLLAACITETIMIFDLRKICRRLTQIVADRGCQHEVVNVINVQNFKRETDGVLIDSTAVLKRCAGCWTHVSTVLPGTWSLQMLLQKEASITELERMMK